jgi:hypothetical protein
MSNNQLKIGNQSPDRQGAVSVELSHLSNVSLTSLVDQHVLKYSGGSWFNATSAASAYVAAGYAAGWSTNTTGSATNAYTNTGSLNSYRTHDSTNWEGTDSQITHGGLDLDRGTEGGVIPTQTRFSRIILDEGKYLLLGTTMANGSSSGQYIEFQWQDTSTSAVLGPRWRQYGNAAKDLSRGIGYVEVSSGTTRTVDMRVVARSGSMYDNPHNFKDDIIMAIQVG